MCVALTQALIALALTSPMRGACYMTVIPLYVADTLGAGPADIGRVLPTLSSSATMDIIVIVINSLLLPS